MAHQSTSELDEWLLSDQAAPWLDIATSSTELPHQLTARLRKHLSIDQTHRVLELTELRRRAENKFLNARQMFFTRTALEQSTDQWIACYKAERLGNTDRVADLCCGIGGDALGLVGKVDELLLCDRSVTMTQFAQRNLVSATPASRTVITTDNRDASSAEIGDFDAWHIDPDRRPAGSRTTGTARHDPNDTQIDRLLAANPTAAIKLAPGCEAPTRWMQGGELEWIGRDGECKQLVVWQGELARAPGQRRATIVKSDGVDYRIAGQLSGEGGEIVVMTEQIERYIFEPDRTVLASDLVGVLSAKYGWCKFGNSDGYLTSATYRDEPTCAAFEVLEVMPLRIKKIASYLRQRGIGNLEIKHRAVALSPERLRSELKLAGDQQATLLATTIGERQVAIMANRVSSSGNESFKP